nr:hypothetical protein CFP56_11498 [Quercus suber]
MLELPAYRNDGRDLPAHPGELALLLVQDDLKGPSQLGCLHVSLTEEHRHRLSMLQVCRVLSPRPMLHLTGLVPSVSQ